MRKFILGLLCGTVIAFSAAAATSTSIQAKLFPSKVTVHEFGQEHEIMIPAGHGVFNYKGSAYVPIRSFAEGMGAKVGYKTASSQTAGNHLIDIYPYEQEQWKLTRATILPCATCNYESGLTVTPNNTRTEGVFNIEINNYKSFGIIVDPIQLIFEIYNNEEQTELLYSQPIPVFSGLIPSKYAYKFTVQWDKTDLLGNKLPKGGYFVNLVRPDVVYYTIEDESEKLIEHQAPSGGFNFPYFSFSIN